MYESKNIQNNEVTQVNFDGGAINGLVKRIWFAMLRSVLFSPFLCKSSIAVRKMLMQARTIGIACFK